MHAAATDPGLLVRKNLVYSGNKSSQPNAPHEKALATELTELDALVDKLQALSLNFHKTCQTPPPQELSAAAEKVHVSEVTWKDSKEALPCLDPISSAETVLQALALVKVQRHFLKLLYDELSEVALSPNYMNSLEIRKKVFQQGALIVKSNNDNNPLAKLILDTNKEIIESRNTLPASVTPRFIVRFKKMQNKCIMYLHALAQKYPQEPNIMELFNQKPSSTKVDSSASDCALYRETFAPELALPKSWFSAKKDPEEEKLCQLERCLLKMRKDLDARLRSLLQAHRVAHFGVSCLTAEALVYKEVLAGFEGELRLLGQNCLRTDLIPTIDGLDWLIDLIKEKLDLFFELATSQMAAVASVGEKVVNFLKVYSPSPTPKTLVLAEIELGQFFCAAQDLAVCPPFDAAKPITRELRTFYLHSYQTLLARHGKLAIEQIRELIKDVFPTIMKRGFLTSLVSERKTKLQSLPCSVEVFLLQEIVSWLHFSDVQVQPKLEVALHNLMVLPEYKELLVNSLSPLTSGQFKSPYRRYIRTRKLDGVPELLFPTISDAFHKISSHLAHQEARFHTILDYAYYSFWITTFLSTLGPKETELKELLEQVQALIDKLQAKFKFPSQLAHDTYEENHLFLLLKIDESLLVPQFFATLTRALYATGPQQITATERLVAFIKSMPEQYDTWKTFPCFVVLRPLMAEILIKRVIAKSSDYGDFGTRALVHTLKLYLNCPDEFVLAHAIGTWEHQLYLFIKNGSNGPGSLRELLLQSRGETGLSFWLQAMEIYHEFLKDRHPSHIDKMNSIVSLSFDIRYQQPLRVALELMRKACKK